MCDYWVLFRKFSKPINSKTGWQQTLDCMSLKLYEIHPFQLATAWLADTEDLKPEYPALLDSTHKYSLINPAMREGREREEQQRIPYILIVFPSSVLLVCGTFHPAPCQIREEVSGDRGRRGEGRGLTCEER